MPDQLVFDPWGLALIVVCAMLVGAAATYIGDLLWDRPSPTKGFHVLNRALADTETALISRHQQSESRIESLEGLFVAKGAHIDGLELRIAAVEELKADQFEQRFDAIFSRLNGISEILTKDDGRLTALETPPQKPKARKH